MEPFSKEWVEKVNSIANRWVKGWGPMSSYGGAGTPTVSIDGSTLIFIAWPTVHGIGKPCRINNLQKYIEDDSMVEIDAKKIYDEEYNTRSAKFDRMREIENSPEVQ